MIKSQDNIEAVKSFFVRYNNFIDENAAALINEDKIRIGEFLSKAKILIDDYRNEKKKSAPDYNIFEILKIRKYEAKVHTPFIANLLNPDGTHLQGDVFLRQFLTTCLEWKPEDFKGFKAIQVIDEKSTYWGNIDIYLRIRNESNKQSIVIENKIYAPDGKDQLMRYFQFLQKTSDKMKIIYLTLDSEAPSEYSINKELYAQLESNNQIKLLSYKKDIKSWLENISEGEKEIPEKVTIILKQYLETIQSL